MSAVSFHPREMMCRGADGGCCSQETPCVVYRPLSGIRTLPLQTLDTKIDLYSQARKSLSERSPFDTDEEFLARVSTLPFKLSLCLSKHSGNHRRKHKKSRSDRNVWVETEDYFRQVTLDDVDFLREKSVALDPSSDSCFSIPLLPGAGKENVVSDGLVPVEESKNEVRVMEIESILSAEALQLKGVKNPAPLPSSMAGLHWLLGCKHRVLLGSERLSNKRKFLDGDMELERVLLVPPLQGGNSFFCHVCCLGESYELGNHFLFCCSCNVTVHQKCYGVQGFPSGRWLCCWCKSMDFLEKDGGGVEPSSRPCLLCPKEGGALKPISGDSDESKTGSGVNFAHLFCSLWMPMLYVENVETMEPTMNFKDIKDLRGKFVCYLCKMKYGICVRCSHGACTTSLHPICAREARQRMEIWGRVGCDNVEMQAFCLKHSGGPEISDIQQSEHMSEGEAAVGETSVSNSLPLTLSMNTVKKLKIVIGHKNGNQCMESGRTTYINWDKMNNEERHLEQGTLAVSLNHRSCCGVSQQILKANVLGLAETDKICGINLFGSCNPVPTLKKLIEQGKANVRDVASEMNMSSVSLASMLNDNSSFPPEMQLKVIKWLLKSARIGTTVQQLKFRSDFAESYKTKCAFCDGPIAVNGGVPGVQSAASVMSLSAKQKRKANKKSLRNHKVDFSHGQTLVQHNDQGILVDEISENPLVIKEHRVKDDTSSQSLLYHQDHPFKEPVITRMQPQSIVEKLYIRSRNGQPDVFWPNASVESRGDHLALADNSVAMGSPGTIKGDLASRSFIRAFIDKRLMKVPNYASLKQENKILLHDGQREKDEQLVKATELGILELSPEDEVEGELLYLQTRLLDNILATKHHCENLIFRVVTNLWHELDALKNQRWNAVLVDQFLLETRESRKEKRHKKDQAVLASAAAAASSGISSFWNDVHDNVVTAHHERPLKVDTVSKRPKPNLHLTPCTKVTNVLNSKSDVPQSCDICNQSETALDPILVCSWCKWVLESTFKRRQLNPAEGMCNYGHCRSSVHPTCTKNAGLYMNIRTIGGEFQQKVYRKQHSLELRMDNIQGPGAKELCNIKQIWVELEKVRLICSRIIKRESLKEMEISEWVLCMKGPFYTKGLLDLKRALSSNSYPLTGFINHTQYVKRKWQDPRNPDINSLTMLLYMQRELVLCSHGILALRREIVAFLVLDHSSFFQPDVSLGVAATTLQTHIDNTKSSKGVHRLDDIAVNSIVSGKSHGTLPLHMDIDRKTDGNCSSHQPYRWKPTDSVPICGKQLPYGPFSFAF